MKKIQFYFLFIFATLIFIAKFSYSQDVQDLIKRVESVGEPLSKSDQLYFIAEDKVNDAFKAISWQDEIVSMKFIKHVPIDDAANWFYFISVKTKNTSTPFYVEHDPYNTFWGTYTHIAPVTYPKEYKDYIAKINAEYDKEQLEKAKTNEELEAKSREIYESVFNEIKPDSIAAVAERLVKEKFNYYLNAYEDSNLYNSNYTRQDFAQKIGGAGRGSMDQIPTYSFYDQKYIIKSYVEKYSEYAKENYMNYLANDLDKRFNMFINTMNTIFDKYVSDEVNYRRQVYNVPRYTLIMNTLIPSLANVLQEADDEFIKSKLIKEKKSTSTIDSTYYNFFKKYVESNNKSDYSTEKLQNNFKILFDKNHGTNDSANFKYVRTYMNMIGRLTH